MSSFSSTLAAHDLKLLALLNKGTEDEAIKFYLEIIPLRFDLLPRSEIPPRFNLLPRSNIPPRFNLPPRSNIPPPSTSRPAKISIPCNANAPQQGPALRNPPPPADPTPARNTGVTGKRITWPEGRIEPEPE
ncbi:hypothetical protein H0H81_005605 [Sphagnurus paluster]|uniref:Uncharacterized protein n=1 Tax=Sphagnurus paluster TaxID=117069 RepID=A0A9P7FN67_9AGAR|nr:hypothetical protein H0H81_005605 [Sphagnurus paluster]